MWSTEKEMENQYPYLKNTMKNMKMQKDRTLKDELPRSVSAQYATGYQWRNNSRNNSYCAVDILIHEAKEC